MDFTVSIPEKSVFKLNEVCGITGVKPYVVRFWESEFEEIAPIASSSGQKLYEHKDIEVISLVKNLLFEQKMSVEEAKKHLASPVEEVVQEELPIEETQEAIIEEIVEEASAEAITIEDTVTFKKSLTDLEVQKLVLAKAKLNSIIHLVDGLQ